jgi:hypothetical protein
MCHMHNSAKESESNEEEINARFQLPKSFLCAQKTMMQLLHVNVSRIVKVWEILGVFIWVVWRFTTVKSRGIIFGIFVESIQKNAQCQRQRLEFNRGTLTRSHPHLH